MQIRRSLASALAFAAALGLPAAATAKDRCVSEAQISAMVIYAVPLGMDALQETCGAELSPGGFFANGAQDMAYSYSAQSDAVWPTAFSAFQTFAGDDEDDGMALLRDMPEETVRPFLDAMIVGLLTREVTPDKCGDIERLLEALAPLEPAEAGQLVAVIAALAGVEDPPICTRR